MVFYFENSKKDIIITEKDKEDSKKCHICRYCEKILNLEKLEVIVIWLVNKEDQLIAFLILLLLRNKATFFLHYTILVIMIVINF